LVVLCCVDASGQQPQQDKFRQIDRRRGELLLRIEQIRIDLETGQTAGLNGLVDVYKDLFILDYDDPRTRLGAALAMQHEPDEQVIEILFDMVLHRKPDDEAMKLCKAHLAKHKDDPKYAIEEIIWAMCNTKEFVDMIRE